MLMLRFNSLQTGTRIASSASGLWMRVVTVSIPFKRERGSQEEVNMIHIPVKPSFNSLQTGTRIARMRNQHTIAMANTRFQFPSNGNADRKGSLGLELFAVPARFNSLQTGTRIASVSLAEIDKEDANEFQFPSNGNADRKLRNRMLGAFWSRGFNSLQTGTRIASATKGTYTNTIPHSSFNSLQTGTRSASPLCLGVV